VPLFVANQVLTAAQQNASAGTGVPVFATTVTRDAAFGGSNKALAEGQLCYIEASNIVQYYDGAAWATVGPATPGALVCVKATTAFTTVSSFTADSVFTSTYDSYLILLQGTVATIDSVYMRFRTGGVDNSSSNYNFVYTYGSNGGTTSSGGTAATTYLYLPDMGTTASGFQITVQTPSTAVPTTIAAFGNRGTSHQYLTSGSNTASTAFDGFKIYSAGGYNMTGTYTIYGYSKTV